MSQLKPCPFCQCADLEVRHESPHIQFVFCKNPECETEGPVGATPDEARRKWNIRKPMGGDDA